MSIEFHLIRLLDDVITNLYKGKILNGPPVSRSFTPKIFWWTQKREASDWLMFREETRSGSLGLEFSAILLIYICQPKLQDQKGELQA